MTKMYVLPAAENWICDVLVSDWCQKHPHECVRRPEDAELIWLLADWRWHTIPRAELDRAKVKVVCTVHHIVPWKFDKHARDDFKARDRFVDVYHTYNARAKAQVELLTEKPVIQRPYWVNDELWRPTASKTALRAKHGIPQDAYVIFSAQRDTEGRDEKSPKREKGPEALVRFLIHEYRNNPKCHILLSGWRRQYVTKCLDDAGVRYDYRELRPQHEINEFYQCADLYPVTSEHEGGPQSLLEAGALNLKVVSTRVGIAEDVLPHVAINDDVSLAVPTVPDVERFKISNGGMNCYDDMFEKVMKL